MIFVTVGTHEQQFNRLVECMDGYAAKCDEEVIIQTGFSSYAPQNARWSKLYPYRKMIEMVKEARVVVTHGGPSSFIMPLQFGKIPIVVPREKQYGEHVNDHQVNFCRQVANRMGTIIEVEKMNELLKVLDNYDFEVKKLDSVYCSNNTIFCEKFENIVVEMFMGIENK